MLKALSASLLTLALVGCKARAIPEADPQVMKTFTHEMQQAVTQAIATADTGQQIGVVKLRVTLDEHSAPIACKAVRARDREGLLPADIPRTPFKALAKVVEEQCWKTIYPAVPAALYEEDRSVEVVAPLIVMLPAAAQAPGTARRQANAQRAFFWQHLLRDQPVNSIGRVSVYYQANAQGKVEDCLVQIYPHPLRPDDFRLDGKLQAQLNSRCQALDLSQLPGFSADMHGVAKGYSELEYAPWRVGRQ